MNKFWIARLVAIASAAGATLAVLAEPDANSGKEPVGKPPVKDFERPRNLQLQIIDEGRVFHGYRSAPRAAGAQAPWKDASYQDLWKSTCEKSPDIQFVLQKISCDDQHKAGVTLWLADIGRSSSLRDYHPSPNLKTDFTANVLPNGPELRNGKKSVLNLSERIAICQMIVNQKEALDKAYEEYLSADEMCSKQARSKLVEMAGLEAVQRLDRVIAKNACPLKVGQPWPDGLLAPQVFPEMPRPFHGFSDVDKFKRETYVGDFE